jgi:hypothetical protein
MLKIAAGTSPPLALAPATNACNQFVRWSDHRSSVVVQRCKPPTSFGQIGKVDSDS